ncbi:MAG: BamA/TamA family outer membrane protein [Chitinophagales bacterium]
MLIHFHFKSINVAAFSLPFISGLKEGKRQCMSNENFLTADRKCIHLFERLREIFSNVFAYTLLIFLFSGIKITLAQILPQQNDSATTHYIHIRQILVDGNRRTREQTILREMTLVKGDSVSPDALMKQIEVSRNQVLNTGLFNEVTMNIKNWTSDSLDLAVSVKERWYTIPVPALDLYDRNFNVWWVDHNHDIRWIQAGLRLYQNNLTGRNDNLKLEALFGFKQTFAIDYLLPYFDAVQKYGFHFAASFNQSRNISYQLINNKELIYEDVNAYQRKIFESSADLFYRPGFHYRYTATLGYKYSFVMDTIAELNPDYFKNGATIQQFMYARLAFTRDYRDIVAYPLKGNFFEATVTKLGFGLFDDVNIWSATAAFSQYVSLGKKWYLSSQTKVKFSFPSDQPYDLTGGLGFGNDYVSGYEYYAIDGQSMGFTKLNLKNQIFKFEIPTPAKNPFTKGAKLPFVIYGRAYVDAGYVRDKTFYADNPLDNKFLIGGGVGIDLVLIYDTTLRFEYSINKMGEHALFFHSSTLF